MEGIIIVTLAPDQVLARQVRWALINLQKKTPKTWPIKFIQDNPYGDPSKFQGPDFLKLRVKQKNVTAHLNKAREIFLDGSFKYFLNIDSDVLVPPFAIEELLQAKADVATGLYPARQYPHYIIPDVDLSKRFVPVDRFGFGCCLIKRCVLEKQDFQYSPSLGPDYLFAKNCFEKGFSCIACTRVKCGHLIEGKLIEIP